MQCMSCLVEVDPKWQHAINSNFCPFCGDKILQEDLKNLLKDLKTTLDKLEEYPDHLQDWLLSNYQFIKTDNPTIVSYIPESFLDELKKIEEIKEFEAKKIVKKTIKVKNEDGKIVEQEIEVEKIGSDSKANEFLERALGPGGSIAGDNKFSSIQEKNAHLKQMKEKIQKGASYIEEEEDEGNYDVEDYNTSYEENIGSGISYGGEELDPAQERILQKMNAMKSGKSGNEKKTLARLRGSVDAANEAFQNGLGGFRR